MLGQEKIIQMFALFGIIKNFQISVINITITVSSFRYEDMKQDLEGVINKVNVFLENPELSKLQVDELKEFLHIDNFKKNPSVNKVHEMRGKTNFIRKGIVGDYRNYFDEKMVHEWDGWLNEEFKETDISM